MSSNEEVFECEFSNLAFMYMCSSMKNVNMSKIKMLKRFEYAAKKGNKS